VLPRRPPVPGRRLPVPGRRLPAPRCRLPAPHRRLPAAYRLQVCPDRVAATGRRRGRLVSRCRAPPPL